MSTMSTSSPVLIHGVMAGNNSGAGCSSGGCGKSDCGGNACLNAIAAEGRTLSSQHQVLSHQIGAESRAVVGEIAGAEKALHHEISHEGRALHHEVAHEGRSLHNEVAHESRGLAKDILGSEADILQRLATDTRFESLEHRNITKEINDLGRQLASDNCKQASDEARQFGKLNKNLKSSEIRLKDDINESKRLTLETKASIERKQAKDFGKVLRGQEKIRKDVEVSRLKQKGVTERAKAELSLQAAVNEKNLKLQILKSKCEVKSDIAACCCELKAEIAQIVSVGVLNTNANNGNGNK